MSLLLASPPLALQTDVTAQLVGYAFPLAGTTTNDNALAGNVGELITSSVATTEIALTSGAGIFNIAAIVLGPGDWDVNGVVGIIPGAAGVPSSLSVMLNTVSGTAPPLGDTNRTTLQTTFATGAAQGSPSGRSACRWPPRRRCFCSPTRHLRVP
jgi:hypothetical protein